MGFRGRIARSTLADANEKRDWRIYADFAQVLIAQARAIKTRISASNLIKRLTRWTQRPSICADPFSHGLISYRADINSAVSLLLYTCYKNIAPKVWDSSAIQESFRNASFGLFLVSPNACASNYIQNDEWPLFHDKRGRIKKPFGAVLLSAVDPQKHDLGVLGQVPGKGRTQLFRLKEGSWDKCCERSEPKSKFATDLPGELLDALGKLDELPRKIKTEDEHDKTVKTSHELTLNNIDVYGNKNVSAKAAPLGNIGFGKDNEPTSEGVPVVPAIREWACDPKDSPFAVLLGEYGMDKIWNSQLLALELEKQLKTSPTSMTRARDGNCANFSFPETVNWSLIPPPAKSSMPPAHTGVIFTGKPPCQMATGDNSP